MDSANLIKAQNFLSTFESHIDRSDSVRSLSDGLDYLYDIVLDAGTEAAKARAVGDRYVTVAIKYVKNMLATGSATEPELEHAHHLMQELKDFEFGSKDEINNVASDTFHQLFDKYYTGYSDEEKVNILKRLLEERKRRT